MCWDLQHYTSKGGLNFATGDALLRLKTNDQGRCLSAAPRSLERTNQSEYLGRSPDLITSTVHSLLFFRARPLSDSLDPMYM
jgi:hypothetical protein